MADYKLLAVLATGNPGVPNASNFGTISKLKVSDALDVTNNITVGGTVDGVDVATLSTNFSTHDGGTAKAQHSAIGDHTHASAGAEGGTIDHGALTGKGDDDHTQYSKADGTRAFTGVVSGVTPTSGVHLATKAYTDAVGKGIDMKLACRAATTAALPACTYNNGTLGVGATLTANANGALPAQDGISMAVDDRILIKNQAAALQNGIYKVTQLGDAGAPFIFTRATDADEAAEVNAGMLTYIDEGTAQSDEQWVNVNAVDTIGTDAQTFTKFGAGMSHDELADVSIDDHHARDHDLDGSEHGTCTKAELSGKITDDTLLGQLDVDDTPVNAATTAPISSNWAYDHENDADQHPEYQKESEKGAASGYASLNASTKVVEQPASITDHLTGSPSNGETTKAPTSDWAYDHVAAADPHTGYQKESEREAASGYAGLNASLKVIKDPANAQTAAAAAKIPIAGGTGKLAVAWISEVLAYSDLTDDPYASHTHQSAGSGVGGKLDHGLALNGLSDDDHTQYHNTTRHDADDHSGFTAANNTYSGNQHINGELTADVIISDGLYGGMQFAKTIGTGGMTAKDSLTFDGSGQIVRRSGASQVLLGIACTTGSASATGYFSPMGILSVLWVSAEEPTSNGEEVFLANTAGNFHKWTTSVPTSGKVYRGIADGTGASAKVVLVAHKDYEFEA